MRSAGFALVLVIATMLCGCGCSGDDEKIAATLPETTTTSQLGGIESLLREANRAERVLEDRVRALVELDSIADVAPQLEGAQADLEEAARRLQDLKIADSLDSARDGLAEALRDLARTLGEVRADLESFDLGGALDALGGLDLGDAEAAIAEIQRLAGG